MRDTGPKSSGLSEIHAARLGILLALLVAAMFALTGASAEAAYIHPESAYEFGPDGLATSAFPGSGSVAEMDYDQSSKRIFMLDKSDGKVYAVNFAGPGSYSAVGSPYPLTVGSAGCCTDIGIDNTSGATAEYLYYSPDGPPLYGFTSAGTPLPAFAPESGEKCGAAVDNEGHFWSGNFSTRKMEEFEPTGGAPIATVDVSGTGFPCRVRFDLSNNDMYVSQYSGQGAVRYTAASGYSAASAQVFDSTTISNIAINATRHVVYVAGRDKVSAYDTATGSLLESFGEESGCFINGIAVDDATDTVFLSRSCTNRIQEWKGAVVPDAVTGEPTGNTTVSGSVALAGGGEVTSCEFQFGTSTEYGQSEPCSPAAPYNSDQALVTADLKEDLEGETTYHYRLVASNANGTAKGVDKTITPHNVKSLATGPATEITNNSALVSGTFEGNGEDTHYWFEWGRTASYGHKTPLPPGTDAGSPTGPTEIQTELTELVPGATYHYRVVAVNGLGLSRGGDAVFSTFQPPSILGFSSSGITATSADISARINPNGFDTEYEVEYGPTSAYGKRAPIPAGLLPAGEATEPVAIHLSDLEGIVYHFRVVAHNKWGTTATSDRTFTFFPPSCPNAVLRQKTGSSYLPDCRAYELVSPPIAGNIKLLALSSPGPYAENPTRFLYLGVDGVLSGTEGTNAFSADTYVATRTISGWVSKYTGIHADETSFNWFAVGDMALDKFINFKSGCCAAQVPFVFDNNEDFLGRWPADWSDFVEETGPNEALGIFQPTPDFTHMAFSSQVNFDAEDKGLTSAPGSAYDYDVAKETTEIISKDAHGFDITQDPSSTDPNEVINFPGPEPFGTGMPKEMYPGVSIDGSHILMGTKHCNGCTEEHLYMRVKDAITYDIAGGAPVNYYGMTSDGTKVFFTSDQQLTTDDHDTSSDLYMWSEQGELEEEPLTRLSTGSGGQGDTDACSASWTIKCDVGMVIGQTVTDYPIATDSGDVYFYSPEVLDQAENGVDGGRNLYVYREGRVQLVATLSVNGAGALTRIQVSPNGAHAAFVTKAKLTGYENGTFREMYSFDPATGGVECVSCIPTGEPPSANVEGSVSGFFMSDDGRTFFSTTDALVAKDTNEGSDVYEFVEGRPQLISTGTGQAYHRASGAIIPLSLMGVSPNGTDVYFSTFDTLVPQDLNGAFLKFYDARTGGGFDFTPPSPPCEAADECHGAGSSPPGSAAITSDANLGVAGNATKARKAKRHPKRRRKRKRKAHHHRKAAHRRANHG